MALHERHPQCKTTSSFSSSLLDAIYNSIDENGGEESQDFVSQRRNNAAAAQDIASLRRVIMVETWMESLNTKRFPLHSSSSSDSSVFSDTEASSATRPPQEAIKGRKKEPVSPCGKIAHFLNSIFSPRNSGGRNQSVQMWGAIRKSRSMKDTTTTPSMMTTTTTLRSCLSKNPSSRGSKSTRAVRFCAVDERIHGGDECSSVGSQFIKKNIGDLHLYNDEGKNERKLHDCLENEHDEDDVSCCSSDLFELENIGHVGVRAFDEELPVYGTTCVEVNNNQAIV